MRDLSELACAGHTCDRCEICRAGVCCGSQHGRALRDAFAVDPAGLQSAIREGFTRLAVVRALRDMRRRSTPTQVEDLAEHRSSPPAPQLPDLTCLAPLALPAATSSPDEVGLEAEIVDFVRQARLGGES